MRGFAALSLLAAAALGFFSVPALAGAKAEFARPPYAGAYEPQGVDERGIWMQMDEHERAFRDSPIVVRDEKLNHFVRSVLCKAIGFDRCDAVRLYIVRDRTFNASMAPNGLMLVHTGLLARVHSEAEMAAVLGHEFAHFELRHSLQGFRDHRTRSDVLSWLNLAAVATNSKMSMIGNAVVAGHFAFSREQETAADLLGAAYIRGSPYRLRASAMWQRLFDEDSVLRAERRLRKDKSGVPGMFDTHPTTLQRIAYHTKLEQEAGGQGEDGVEGLRDICAPMLDELFEGLIKSNEFASADYVIRMRGDAMGWDGHMLALRGELYRQRANPRDLGTARQFFQQATTQPDAPPESWRGLGFTALRLGEAETGRAALAEYLKRRPDAQDAASVKMLLEN